MNTPLVNFEVNQPLDEAGREANIRASLKRSLPAFDDEPIRTLTLIANGPSARSKAALRCAARHQLNPSPVACLNGALKLFMDKGLTPDFWLACDPQPMITDFLVGDIPWETTYIIGSKCDPSVFERLKGYDVRLWHINDSPLVKKHRPVKLASSVTLSALSLFRQVGFRHFEIHGWDCCYGEDGNHHAFGGLRHPTDTDTQLNIGGEMTETGPIGGTTYNTNHTWCLEIQDAIQQLHHADYTVKVHGPGMMKAALEFAQCPALVS